MDEYDPLAHLIGSKDERLRFLPDLHKSAISKEARRRFNEREKLALIEEEGAASNAHRIDVRNTHYESQSAQDIALLMMPLKGL